MTLLEEVRKEKEILSKKSAEQMIKEIEECQKRNRADIKKLFK